MICSPVGDTDYLEIVTRILQADTWIPFLPRLRTSNIIDQMKENGWMLTKKGGKKQTIFCKNYYWWMHEWLCKYTYSSRIPAAWSEASSMKH